MLGYTVALGIPELREAIAGHHRRMHGLDVTPEDVVVTTGSSGGFLLAFLAAFEAGDRVAIARPGADAVLHHLPRAGRPSSDSLNHIRPAPPSLGRAGTPS